MKTTTRLLAVCAVLLGIGSLCPWAVANDNPVRPTPSRWVVAEVLDSAPVTGLDDAQAAALAGEPVTFGVDRISFEQVVCREAQIVRKHQPTARFFRDYRIKAPPGWSRQAEWWEARCRGADTIGPFLVNGNDMVFVWYGVLLHARAAPGE